MKKMLGMLRNEKRSPLTNRKLIAIFLFFGSILAFVIFAGRFSYIMVKGEVNGENLETNVNNLYTRSSVLEANRGTIYDVGGIRSLWMLLLIHYMLY